MGFSFIHVSDIHLGKVFSNKGINNNISLKSVNTIFSNLVDFAIEKIIENGKGGIQLTTHVANVRAQALYEKKGFVCMGLAKNGAEMSYLLRFHDK